MEQSQFLDADIILEKSRNDIHVENDIASPGRRFVNFIVDFGVLLVIVYLVFLFINSRFKNFGSSFFQTLILSNVIYNSIRILYYTLFEAIAGKTLGKYVTNTRAVNEEGESISFGQALGRTLCRLIPFEVFSFLGGDLQKGWHDTIPKTRVIED